MSSGKPEDCENTKRQLMHPDPISKNRTWLGHLVKYKDGTNAQCGTIDLMVLEGKYSISEIARKINNTIERVERHLNHLQTGDASVKASDMKPHKLRIVKGANDKIKFFHG
jgi:hypothetical protein